MKKYGEWRAADSMSFMHLPFRVSAEEEKYRERAAFACVRALCY